MNKIQQTLIKELNVGGPRGSNNIHPLHNEQMSLASQQCIQNTWCFIQFSLLSFPHPKKPLGRIHIPTLTPLPINHLNTNTLSLIPWYSKHQPSWVVISALLISKSPKICFSMFCFCFWWMRRLRYTMVQTTMNYVLNRVFRTQFPLGRPFLLDFLLPCS